MQDMEEDMVAQQECFRCHTTYHWRHLKMEHKIPTGRSQKN
jgi:hypothetical protein